MQHYKNISGKSGVTGFELGDDFIRVQFNSGKIYLYTYDSAGRDNIEIMKQKALEGIGLNSYIMKNVKDLYEDII